MKKLFLFVILFANTTLLFSQNDVIVKTGNMSDLPMNRVSQDDINLTFGKIKKNSTFRLEAIEVKDGKEIVDSETVTSIQENIKMKLESTTLFLLQIYKSEKQINVKKTKPSYSISIISIKPLKGEKLDFGLFNTPPNIYNNIMPIILIYNKNESSENIINDILSEPSSKDLNHINLVKKKLSKALSHYYIISYFYEYL